MPNMNQFRLKYTGKDADGISPFFRKLNNQSFSDNTGINC